MRHRTRRRHLLIALLSILAILAGACSSGANDKARTAVAGLENGYTNQGDIPVYVYNDSDTTITLNINAGNRGRCSTNKWRYKGNETTGARLDPLGPGRRINNLAITTRSCFAGQVQLPRTDADTFTIGIEGASQFGFNVDWGGNGNFVSVRWSSYYTGGGRTYGLVQYNAGNSDILGNGKKPGRNADFSYAQGQQIYFAYCPTAVDDERILKIPNSCLGR